MSIASDTLDSPPPRSKRSMILLSLLGGILAICLTALIAIRMVLTFVGGMTPNLFPGGDKLVSIKSQGPTVLRLQKMQHLVSSQIHVSDVMIAESTYLQGSWLIRGDALLAVDMASAEVMDRDEEQQTATIKLAEPQVMSPRVDHEKTREWDIKGRSWIPWSKEIMGNTEKLRQSAMMEAQNVIARVANQPEYKEKAKKNVEQTLREFYGQTGWTVTIQWR